VEECPYQPPIPSSPAATWVACLVDDTLYELNGLMEEEIKIVEGGKEYYDTYIN